MKMLKLSMLFMLILILACNDDSTMLDGPGSHKFGEIYGSKKENNIFELSIREAVCYSHTNCYDEDDKMLTHHKSTGDTEDFFFEYNDSIIFSLSKDAESSYKIEMGTNVPLQISQVEISWSPVNESDFDSYTLRLKRSGDEWEFDSKVIH